MRRASKSPATRAKRKSRPRAFPVEFRLRIVTLYLENGYSSTLIVEQFGIGTHSIRRWVRAFRLLGADRLEPTRLESRRCRVAEQVMQPRPTQMERASSCGAAVQPCGSGGWPALAAGGLGKTGPGAVAGECPPGACHFAAQDRAQRCAGRFEARPRYQPGGKK
jgi:transposase-like protein